ncbi:MAG: glycerol-3-phosphate dehydrogenase/oxidase [Acidimicrobiales bacterium]
MNGASPAVSGGVLSPSRRRQDLAAMEAEVLDVVVVGGGITGAGVALDAATRGLTVGLVEARDWAAGSSSRSSKLIHGGLRYLEQLRFTLVRESLRERTLLMETLSPHLVRPVSFLIPLRHRRWERVYVGSGLVLYDLLAGVAAGRREGAVPRHRYLNRRETLELAPGLRAEGLRGSIRYCDALVDDARFTVEVVRTAATHGARVVNDTKVVRFLRRGERVNGVIVRDEESGADLQVRARRVICAGGVWTESLQSRAGVSGGLAVRMSKGVHLVLPKERLALDTGLLSRTEKSVLFVIPWGKHWIVGTTDTDWDGSPDEPPVDADDVAYLLDRLNAELATQISPADVVATYAGLRPLLQGRAASTAQLSREHAVTQPAPGLTVVAGGKYTTYRVMAADAVDRALSDLPGEAPRSQTTHVPLVGAVGYAETRADARGLAARAGLGAPAAERLLGRYGGLLGELLGAIGSEPGLGAPVPGAGGYLLAEARYAASHEGARHLADVLERRTRIAIEYPDHGSAAAEAAARAVAPVLGWTPSHREAEVADYRRRVAAGIRTAERDDAAT